MAKYFTIEELTRTSTGLDNTPNELETKHLEELIEVLDDIREAWTEKCRINNWGSPSIIVNSGFRSEEVNKAVGGSKTSEHRLGYAVDIEPSNQRMKEFWDFIVDYVKTKKLNFSQLIKEKPRNDIASWFHLSINGLKGYRKQIFTLI
jgi:hypothetical protein